MTQLGKKLRINQKELHLVVDFTNSTQKLNFVKLLLKHGSDVNSERIGSQGLNNIFI